MRDFNFFSPYILEDRNKRQHKQFIIAASALAVLALLSFTSLNIYQIIRYKHEISTVENYMNSPKTIEMLGKYNDTSKRVVLTKEYFEKVSEAAQLLRSNNTVSTVLLDKLSSAMTQDSVMTKLSIKDRKIEAEYQLSALTSVAEIEHNIKELGIFSNVFVNVINNDSNYTAIISCDIKDVESSEAETDK